MIVSSGDAVVPGVGRSETANMRRKDEQLLDRVPEERKVKNARLGLTHNLGGFPWANVAAISIVGRN